MPPPVNAIVRRLAWVSLWATVSTSSPAGADDQEDGEDRWAPSLAVISGVTIEEERGSVRAIDSAGRDLRPPQRGSDLGISPFVGADFELLTPALPIPGRPRLFVSGEILPTFGGSRDLAKEGNPVGIRGPDVPTPPPPALPALGYPEEALQGQGSRATSEVDTLSYGAGLGLAFPFEWRGRRLRVKTSFEWTSFKLNYEGLVLRGQCLPDPAPPVTSHCISFDTIPLGDPVQGFTREIMLFAEGSQTFHAIGPGLEIELETGRAGPLGHSLFIGARAYRILGDRTFGLFDTATFDDPIGMEGTRSDWSFEVDRWMYRAGVGLRLYWLGSAG